MLQYKYINSSWETVSQQRTSFHKFVHVEYTSYTQLSYFTIIFLDAHPILKLLDRCDYSLNCTLVGPITITNHRSLKFQ